MMQPSSILFINRVYPPAEGATGQLLAELAEELVRRGHLVTVVTSHTSFALPESEMVRGVRVERVGALPFTRASHWRRALSYASLYPALLRRALRLPKHDVVVTLTDPPLQLLLGPVIKRFKGSRLIHWAQDLYPELAEEFGVLSRKGFFANLLRSLSTWALRQSDGVIAVGHCMKACLKQRGITADAVSVISNWGGSKIKNSGGSGAKQFRVAHGLDDRFVVMYSGNLGLAHPFEAMMDAAERLRTALPKVVFFFVGDGPRLPWVQQQVRQRHLDNVRFLPFQPKERLADSLGAADVHLASMRHELCGLVVPSKVFGVLAAGRPCVFLGPEESEAAQAILQHGCGSVLPKATGARLAACLTQWVNHPESLQEAAKRAENAVERVNLGTAADGFEQVVAEVMDPDAARRIARTARLDEQLAA